MSDFFGGLRGGIKMPEVVWNQGPLPSGDGLPAPLHQTADARINYNSSLLGDLTPYAYGKPGYLSSQTAYLNIPHKVQKIVPVIWLPEARVGTKELVDLPHPVDDGDIAFVLRLNRSSIFCTGTKSGDMRRMGLGTAVDPLVNLPTVNYILSGLQLGMSRAAHADGKGDMWLELMHSLEPFRFPGGRHRDFEKDPVNLDDIVQFVRHCVKPFGVVRGSEKQGGQDEATLAPATWPVSFVTSVTIDGKESNVINAWHHLDLSAGDDLVLRLKLLPVKQYTLNHYYKGVKRHSWDHAAHDGQYIWQLAPDIMNLDQEGQGSAKEQGEFARMLAKVPAHLKRTRRNGYKTDLEWQELGFWHVGRSQIMTGRYGVEEYWHNDMANMLKTNHLDITFQPSFRSIPAQFVARARPPAPRARISAAVSGPAAWTASLGLEKLGLPVPKPQRPSLRAPVRPPPAPSVFDSGRPAPLPGLASDRPAPLPGLASDRPEPLPFALADAESVQHPEEAMAAPASLPEGGLPWLDEPVLADMQESAPEPNAPSTGQAPHEDDLAIPVPGLAPAMDIRKVQRGPKRRGLSGSLVRVDGTSEASQVGLL